MSSDSYHYMFLAGIDVCSLFAEPRWGGEGRWVQHTLPTFGSVMQPIRTDPPMKGVWNKEKSANTDYKPALDALLAVQPELIAKAIYAAIADGGALMFAATRDFGAINITLMVGQERHKVYPVNVQELEATLRDLVESLHPEPSSPPAKRSAR